MKGIMILKRYKLKVLKKTMTYFCNFFINENAEAKTNEMTRIDSVNKFHVIEKITPRSTTLRLVAKVSNKKFDMLAYFLSSCNRKLSYRKLHRGSKYTTYRVEIPKYKEDNSKKEFFYAVYTSGKREQVWKPSPSLKTLLPERYGFTYKYLNFFYDAAKKSNVRPFTPILKKITYSNHDMNIEGYLFLPVDEEMDLTQIQARFFKFRQESVSHIFPFSIRAVHDRSVFGLFHSDDFYRYNQVDIYVFEIIIPLMKIEEYQGIFNIVFTYEGQTRFIQNYHSSLLKNEHIHRHRHDQGTAVYNFYFDDVNNVWRFEIYQMSDKEYEKFGKLQAVSRRDSNVWLIGEYTLSARDNGMHFYHYMLQKHPEKEVYYVIESDAVDRKNLDQSRLLFYGSYDHFEVASRAKVLAFTHLADYLIPKINHITSYRQRYKNYFKVFLQHGITAPTRISIIARKELRNYELVNATSAIEAKIFEKYLGYDREISINGFPRWDRLYRESHFTKSILVIPTHRDNLWRVSDDEFLDSDYYRFWSALLHDEKLIAYIEENDIKIHFFLHIILARFAKHFQAPSSNISFSNDEDIQTLLLSCGALVTDYSSVAFDALYQDKPVIYAPFDYEEMMQRRGGEPFIDYENDLPGPLCYEVEELVEEIIGVERHNWAIHEKYRPRLKKFFKYIDDKNSQRVYRSIEKRLSMDI